MDVLDANVFIRAITGDDPERAARAVAYFEGLAVGPSRAVTTDAILAEVIFVLGSARHYHLPRPRVAEEMRAILALPGLSVDHPASVERALNVFETSSVDFPDALVVALAERIGADAIVSFDRDYDRFPSVTRREP